MFLTQEGLFHSYTGAHESLNKICDTNDRAVYITEIERNTSLEQVSANPVKKEAQKTQEPNAAFYSSSSDQEEQEGKQGEGGGIEVDLSAIAALEADN